MSKKQVTNEEILDLLQQSMQMTSDGFIRLENEVGEVKQRVGRLENEVGEVKQRMSRLERQYSEIKQTVE